MAPVMRRVVLVLTGIALAFTAAGSAPALAATRHSAPGTPAFRQGHLARMTAVTLHHGEALGPGESLTSGTVTLVMQGDGNLVLYPDGLVGNPNVALWDSDTRGNNTALLQGDGNFVIYPTDELGNASAAEWATDTHGSNVLVVQVDGNVVIYPSCCVGDPYAAEWATDTPVFGLIPRVR